MGVNSLIISTTLDAGEAEILDKCLILMSDIVARCTRNTINNKEAGADTVFYNFESKDKYASFIVALVTKNMSMRATIHGTAVTLSRDSKCYTSPEGFDKVLEYLEKIRGWE